MFFPNRFRDGCLRRPGAVGETFEIRYEIFGRPPNADAPDMLIRLAAVPAVAARQAYMDKQAPGEGVDALCEFLSK